MTTKAGERMAGKKSVPAGHAMTPEELEVRVNAYFDVCAAEDVFPDRANMILYLGLPTAVFNLYENDEDEKNAAFSEVLRKARLKREGWLSRVMFADKNKAQSAIFQLRQPTNGSYSDRQETETGHSIRVKIDSGDPALLE
jgi:hypothetical protein